MMETKYRLTYQNTSNQYQLVADTRQPIACGTEEEVLGAFGNFHNIESSKYSSIEIVAPGETSDSDYIHNDTDLVTNYDFDIMDIFIDPKSKSAQILGKLGGESKSLSKQAASRINGKLGGRPKHNN